MSKKRIQLDPTESKKKILRSHSPYKKEDVEHCHNDSSSIDILSSNRNFNELDQSFMYSQLLKETILDIEYDNQARKLFADFWRLQYPENDPILLNIHNFEINYALYSSIWWYTKESFIYSKLNQALRT